MAIKLNTIRTPSTVQETLEQGYLYKDVKFDLNLQSTAGGELFRANDNSDLESLYDSKAIITSLKNILTTSPGEKLLNPQFGLDLRDYLFEPVSENRAFFIGQDILFGLAAQEPRISLDEVLIIAIPEENAYEITLSISIPTLKVYEISLKGVLNNDGYTFV